MSMNNEPCDNCLLLPICLSKDKIRAIRLCSILYNDILKQTKIFDDGLKPNKKVEFFFGTASSRAKYIIERVYRIHSLNKSVRVLRCPDTEGPLRHVYFYNDTKPLYNELEWDGGPTNGGTM